MCERSSNGSSTWGSEQSMSSRTGDVDSQTVYSRQYLTQPKYDISWDFRKSWYCASCSAALVWQCGHPEYLMSHVVLLRSFRTSESCITVIFKLHRKRYSAPQIKPNKQLTTQNILHPFPDTFWPPKRRNGGGEGRCILYLRSPALLLRGLIRARKVPKSFIWLTPSAIRRLPNNIPQIMSSFTAFALAPGVLNTGIPR